MFSILLHKQNKQKKTVYSIFFQKKNNMGKKNKKGGSALAEEVSDTDSFLGKIGKSVGGEDSNFSTRKILLIFIGGCALLWFVFLLTILILTAEIKNDVDGSSFSSSISSGLSEDG